MSRWLRTSIIVLAVVIVGLGAWRIKMMRDDKKAIPDFGPLTPFAFTDQDGKQFGTADLAGKIWVADFFFTRCMGPCPMLTTRMAELQNTFKNRNDIAFVSISVDPDFDQPAVLKKYASTYGANESNWKFLTGPAQSLYTMIRTNFKLAVAPNDQATTGEIDIMHSTYFVLVDAAGHIRGFYNSVDMLAMNHLKQDIKNL